MNEEVLAIILAGIYALGFMSTLVFTGYHHDPKEDESLDIGDVIVVGCLWWVILPLGLGAHLKEKKNVKS